MAIQFTLVGLIATLPHSSRLHETMFLRMEDAFTDTKRLVEPIGVCAGTLWLTGMLFRAVIWW